MVASDKYREFFWGVALYLAAILLWFVYKPGLTGPFFFDDFVNIQRLGRVGCVHDQYSFLKFVFGGQSPLQDVCWPTDPEPFKVFNVLIHILNFFLVFVFARMLLRVVRVGRPEFAALVVAFVWAVHPIQSTPIFLVVQRMTLMMGTFVLLGLILYTKGRQQVAERQHKGQLLMWVGLGVAGGIGVLAKESALAVPFYVVALELTLFRNIGRGEKFWWRLFCTVCLLVPVIAIVIYVILDPNGSIAQSWGRRDFTSYEKFISEFRVIFSYLGQLLIPRLSSFRLYHDDYPISHGLLDPATTLLSIIGLLAMVGSAFTLRKRWPLIAFGILWFVGGHFLEAFVLPIEVYFEHRNYLPSFGIWMAVAGVILHVRPSRRVYIYPVMLLLVVVLGFMSWSNAKVWSSLKSIVSTWFTEDQNSSRVYSEILTWSYNTHDVDTFSYLLLDDKFAKHDDLVMEGMRLIMVCGDDFQDKWKNYVANVGNYPYGLAIYTFVDAFMVPGKACEKLTNDDTKSLLFALLKDPRYSVNGIYKQNLYLSLARAYSRDRDLNSAMYYADKAFEVRGDPDILALQAVWLVSAGLYDDALEYARRAAATPERTHFFKLTGRPDFVSLEKAIENDLKKAKRGDAGKK